MLQLQQESLLLRDGTQRRISLQLLLGLTAVTATLAWAPSSSLASGRQTLLLPPQQQQLRSWKQQQSKTTKIATTNMIMDPNDLLLTATAGHNLADAAATASTGASGTLLWDSLVSTMMSTHAAVLPAHGHSQPFFGPPDPYLTSGRSIAPSMQALKELMSNSAGTTVGDAATSVDPTAAAATNTPQISERLQSAMQAAIAKGWRVADASTLHPQSLLPGFSETQGILPRHDVNMPEQTVESFVRQVEWSTQFLNVVDKIPSAALFYVVVDFFFLRPTRDVMYYKEDVEDDPSRALVETISATSIRVGVFAIIAVITLMLFGGGD